MYFYACLSDHYLKPEISDPKFDAAFRDLLKINNQIESTKQNKSHSSFCDMLNLSNHINKNGGEISFDSMKQSLYESNVIDNNKNNKTTEDIIMAYLRTKNRIDKLNITSLLR